MKVDDITKAFIECITKGDFKRLREGTFPGINTATAPTQLLTRRINEEKMAVKRPQDFDDFLSGIDGRIDAAEELLRQEREEKLRLEREAAERLRFEREERERFQREEEERQKTIEDWGSW